MIFTLLLCDSYMSSFFPDRPPMMRRIADASYGCLFDAPTAFSRFLYCICTASGAPIPSSSPIAASCPPRERHRVLRLHAIQPTHDRAAHCRPGLRPGMYPFRHLPFGPADLIAGMWTGASINGTAAGTARILRHMRRDIARPTVGHKFSRIVVLVGPQRAPLGIRPVRVSRVGPSSPALLRAQPCRSRESTWPRLQSRAGSR